MKVALLHTVTKSRFRVFKAGGHLTLDGYVFQPESIHHFEHKLPATLEAKQTIPSLLWYAIQQSSNHIDDWRDLFCDAPTTSDDELQAMQTA